MYTENHYFILASYAEHAHRALCNILVLCTFFGISAHWFQHVLYGTHLQLCLLFVINNNDLDDLLPAEVWLMISPN